MSIEVAPSKNYPGRLAVSHKLHSDSNMTTIIELTEEDVAELVEKLRPRKISRDEFDVDAGDRSPFPADAAAKTALTGLKGDRNSRVVIRLENPDLTREDSWHDAVDLRTGRAIAVRRADCGLGCKCAAEVKLA